MDPITHLALDWAPRLPWTWILALAAISGLLSLFALIRRARGAFWRALALAVVLLILANPQVIEEQHQPIADTLVVLIDDSPSQQIGDRPAQTQAAQERIRQWAATVPNLTLRERSLSSLVTVGQGRGTPLMAGISAALADIPRQRLAGTVVITDGQAHDIPERVSADLVHEAPLHLFLTGQRDEQDRRLIIEQAPSFALVNSPATVRLRVEDPALPAGASVALTVTQADQPEAQPLTVPVTVGRSVALPIRAPHVGPALFSLSVPQRDGELTQANNRAAITLNGLRDRLRVLLISGRPHMGERAWRDLLTADPNVDLVHFTILRSPLKADSAPLNELALIAFPMRELFEEKLSGFDLIIFDSYARDGPVLGSYLESIAAHVRQGGALLVATGPDFRGFNLSPGSMLHDLLPVTFNATAQLGTYQPMLSAQGQRHPITAPLVTAPPGSDPDSPPWGPWLRVIPAQVQKPSASVLMQGPQDLPLLVVDRVEQGRVGVLLSDSLWLWAKGWRGGGPQAELVRRLAHWLMDEPDLEEEALTVRAENGALDIARRSLSDQTAPWPITLTAPDGQEQTVTLRQHSPGRWSLRQPVDQAGLWKLRDDSGPSPLQTAALVPDPNPREQDTMVATADIVSPLVETSRGGIFWLHQGIPDLRHIPPNRSTAAGYGSTGAAWAGFYDHQSTLTVGYRQTDMLPALAWVLLLIGALAVAWRQEGR